MHRDILLVTTDLGVDKSGTYRPGGMQLFSRMTLQALSESPDIQRLGVLSIVDTQEALDKTLRPRLTSGPQRTPRIELHGAGGNRRAFVARYLRERLRYRSAMFMHINVARLAILTPLLHSSTWLVGVEVRRRLALHERLALRLARPMLSISDFSTREMQRFNPSLPSATTVHLSVEPETAGSESAPPAYQASERAPAVLIVARMAADERYKGHDQLIEGWPEVVAACPSAELWIVGQGDDTPRLRARAAALPAQVSAQVKFLGRVGPEALLECYARARVFAMPSTGEGFGLVFVEAMRSGLPCIAGPDSAAEIVEHGRSGLVVTQDAAAIAKACVTLLSDDALANRFSAEGRARQSAHFTFPAFRQRLWQTLGLTGTS
jgi:phosphatidylinositol alpha-1,6-mannosyltransferase